MIDTDNKLSQVIAGAMRLGKWGQNFNTAQYIQFIESCLELGVDSFDHADIYGDYTTEAEFGQALKEQASLRHQIKIITKCGIKMVADARPEHQVKSYDASAEHIIASCEQSLQNFNTDYINCLLIHRPDILIEPNEVAEAVSQLMQDGKILSFGISNFTAEQSSFLLRNLKMDVHQFEASLMHLDPFNNGVVNQCTWADMIPLAWSPLAGGKLFEDNPRASRIKEVAKPMELKYELSFEKLMIAFLGSHPAGIIPVLGTHKIERIADALDAMDFLLEKEDWYALYQASTGEEIA